MPATLTFDTTTAEGRDAFLAMMDRLAGPKLTAEDVACSARARIASFESLIALLSRHPTICAGLNAALFNERERLASAERAMASTQEAAA